MQQLYISLSAKSLGDGCVFWGGRGVLVLVLLPVWAVETKQLRTFVCSHNQTEMHASPVCFFGFLSPFILAWISKEFGKSALGSEAGERKLGTTAKPAGSQCFFAFLCLQSDVLDSLHLFPPPMTFLSAAFISSLWFCLFKHYLFSEPWISTTSNNLSTSYGCYLDSCLVLLLSVVFWKSLYYLYCTGLSKAHTHFMRTTLWCLKRRLRYTSVTTSKHAFAPAWAY